MIAHHDYQLTSDEQQKLDILVKDYRSGVPLPYLLGYWEFYGRKFKVSPDVLIPRPETELLVEKAILHAKKFHKPLLLDIGTGSGAISVSLAAEIPSAWVIATDISLASLRIALENAKTHNQETILFLQADLLPHMGNKPDIICANLPYIPTELLQTLDVYHKEPGLALDGGEEGLDLIQKLLIQAQSQLATPGIILLEIEANQGRAATFAAKAAFQNATVHLFQDLQGRDRLIEIQQV